MAYPGKGFTAPTLKKTLVTPQTEEDVSDKEMSHN